MSVGDSFRGRRLARGVLREDGLAPGRYRGDVREIWWRYRGEIGGEIGEIFEDGPAPRCELEVALTYLLTYLPTYLPAYQLTY